MSSEKKKRLLNCILFVLIFTFLSQGYRYLNLSYSGDSTFIFQGPDTLYQISLGRFLQPVYWHIRGKIVAPFLICFFSTLFLCCSAFLVCTLLEINSPKDQAAVCGILTTNELISLSNATYMPWTDVYMLALLLVILGIYLFTRLSNLLGFILSVFCFSASVALYPPYIACASTLYILYYLRLLFNDHPLSEIWKKGSLSIFSLAAGLLFYAAILRLVLASYGIQASQEYNGVGRLQELTFSSLLKTVPSVYSIPVQYFFNPWNRQIIPSHRTIIPAWINLILLLFILIQTAAHSRRFSKGRRATMLFLFLLLPFAMNFVVLISDGIVNGLMIYAFFFFYLLPLLFPHSSFRFSSNISSCFLFILIAVNIAVGNQLAIKRDLEYKATLSAMTRILDDAEQIPEYLPGSTPVYIHGYLPSSKISMPRDGFDRLSAMQGVRYTYSASYEISTMYYLKQILNDPIVFCDAQQQQKLLASHSLNTLPKYPDAGYITMLDGILVIRL